MTLILTLGNTEQMIQVSDRRLSWEGKIIEDESSKAGLLTCRNARLAFGFTGLAKSGHFNTRDWLLEAIGKCGPPEYTAKEVLERLRIRASDAFRGHPALRMIDKSTRRLSIMFSGYLCHHSPPLGALAVLTNFQDFQTGLDDATAWDEFRLTFWSERRPSTSEPTLIQRIGNWRAMSKGDERTLRDLLEDRKPSEAIIGKAVELVREMADRPTANNTIGKQLSVVCVPRSPELSPNSGYYSAVNTYTSYLADMVVMTPSGSWIRKDALIRKLGAPATSPLYVPKVGRNRPCPCGSGAKYKRCHGKPLPSSRVPLRDDQPI